jgi:hypothetical protein
VSAGGTLQPASFLQADSASTDVWLLIINMNSELLLLLEVEGVELE